MADLAIRKGCLTIERDYHEGGPALETPLLKGAVTVVVASPFVWLLADGDVTEK